jgi:FdhD protein
MKPRTIPVTAHRVDTHGGENVEERVIAEYPLQLMINNQAFTVTMRTPGDDVALARGLLYAEEIIGEEGFRSTSTDTCNGTIMRIELPERTIDPGNRTLMSVSSCGLCGKRDLSDVYKKYSVKRAVEMDVELIHVLFQRMQAEQKIFHLTGGCHAAAAATVDGQLLCVFEDVGRHNAVDKVIGSLLESNQLNDAAIMLVSGRVSYEILQKTARANIPILAAVSAPTALSVNFAAHWGMTLAGFCREDRMTLYCGQHRLVAWPSSAEAPLVSLHPASSNPAARPSR